MTANTKSWALHIALLVTLFTLQFVLPAYHQGNIARIMMLAVFAMGYNIMFGYTGLLSLGHALFFATGMYGMGLSIQHLGISPATAFVCGIVAALLVTATVGVLALRTSGVAFMIVTLMFAQSGYLAVLFFGEYTRGDEGFVIKQAQRVIASVDLADATNRYFAALLLFALCIAVTLKLVTSQFGHVLVAVRENEERAQMLGYDTFKYKLAAVLISGTISGVAGAGYGLLFGYVGANFATVQYSIYPLLWVLLGGAGTIMGPFFGTLFMFYLIDLASDLTSAYMLIAGVALVLLTLFARNGLMGEIRKRVLPWLP
ncbi:MAG: branched-chain amino acid ABC transporter permease [Hyphomicrobiales bacterium]|nr:branched-chain amino acid ABC transporter permease [Hyphomicrobiales bacterium]